MQARDDAIKQTETELLHKISEADKRLMRREKDQARERAVLKQEKEEQAEIYRIVKQ